MILGKNIHKLCEIEKTTEYGVNTLSPGVFNFCDKKDEKNRIKSIYTLIQLFSL